MKYTLSLMICLVLGMAAVAQKGAALYFGPGFGFDHGGLGLKIIYQPEKHIGIFGGAGYNLAKVGANGGLIYTLLPNKRVTPVLTAMYGYNAVIKLTYANGGRKDYTVYNGLTVGAGVDIKLGHSRENKININLLVPLRSAYFFRDYNYLLENGSITQKMIPVGISFGWDLSILK